MKTCNLLFASVLSAVLLLPFSGTQASFGELDIVVRESIEAHFREYDYSVDLRKLEYRGEPELEGDTNDILVVRTSVWAEQRLIAPYWGWHECETRVAIKGRGIFEDLGTRCYFDFD